MKAQPSLLPEGYPLFLQDIKTQTRRSRNAAILAVNQELIQLYWWIGSEIVKCQEKEKWEPGVIDRFCKDIQSSFPDDIGFSQANLVLMRTFYLSHAKVQRAAGLLETPPDYCFSIPWGHHIVLMKKVRNLVEREWYARKTIENGWSVEALAMQIESGLYDKQHKAKE